MYKIHYINRAKKDTQLIKSSNLNDKVKALFDLIAQNPYTYPPEFYQVPEEESAIKVLLMCTHYFLFFPRRIKQQTAARSV